MCRSDKAFDPFVESTVDGIIAGSVSVKVRQHISTILIFTFVLDPNNHNDILILININDNDIDNNDDIDGDYDDKL